MNEHKTKFYIDGHAVKYTVGKDTFIYCVATTAAAADDICRACNSHEAMLRQLENVAHRLYNGGSFPPNALNEINAVIKLAKS